MKKTVKALTLALVAMSLAVACNNNNTPAEEPIDTMVPVVDSIVEEVIDSTPVEEVVVDEPVKKAAPAKKKAKKEEPKTEVKVDASKMTISTNTNKGTATLSDKGVSVKGKNGEAQVDASKMSIKTNKGGSVSAGNGSLTIKQ